ncbi:hypothetical protein [Brachybacterium hainanense]|uniref:Uncharacterized protein n=1 Tax=Brachybacterium hainanense TaxID=1541174 RepID=A0ABV6RF12_9MICO
MVLVWAPWATPSRPGVTVLRELDRRARREGRPVSSWQLPAPSDEELTAWHLEVLPTWLCFEKAEAPDPAGDAAATPSGASCADEARSAAAPSAAPPPAVLDAVDTARLLPADPDAEDLPSALLLEDRSGSERPGRWVETVRVSGAAPKHEIATGVYASAPFLPGHAPGTAR